MISDQLKYDIDFTKLLIEHTKKTMAKGHVDVNTKTFLAEQLQRLEFKLEKYRELLPKKNAKKT